MGRDPLPSLTELELRRAMPQRLASPRPIPTITLSRNPPPTFIIPTDYNTSLNSPGNSPLDSQGHASQLPNHSVQHFSRHHLQDPLELPYNLEKKGLPLPSLSPSATHFQRYRVSKPTKPINCRHKQIHHSYQPDTDIPSYTPIQSISGPVLAPRDSPPPSTPASPLLRPTAFTEKQEKRRRNHLTSEKKRRENIKLGMCALFDLVPTCLDKSESKAQVLRKTTAYILELKSEVETLKREREKFRMEGGLVMAQMGTGRA